MADLNYKASVEATLRRFADHLEQPSGRVDFVRRQILVEVLKAFPSPHDWALLHKTERGEPPFYPSDIGWHVPSGEHYDVLTDKDVPGHPERRRIAAAWVNQGINDRMRDKRWKPVKVEDAVGIPPLPGASEPTPEPEPGPEPMPDPSPYVDLLKAIGGLKADVMSLRAAISDVHVRLDAAEQRAATAEGRLTALEEAPFPDHLEVNGSTGSEWGHRHRIQLTVQRKA